jgi:hypothetical protein
MSRMPAPGAFLRELSASAMLKTQLAIISILVLAPACAALIHVGVPASGAVVVTVVAIPLIQYAAYSVLRARRTVRSTRDDRSRRYTSVSDRFLEIAPLSEEGRPFLSASWALGQRAGGLSIPPVMALGEQELRVARPSEGELAREERRLRNLQLLSAPTQPSLLPGGGFAFAAQLPAALDTLRLEQQPVALSINSVLAWIRGAPAAAGGR